MIPAIVTAAGYAAGREDERGDVLAFLRRRRDNAAAVSGRPGMSEFADDRRRQLDVLIEHIAQGLHEDEAEVAAVRATITAPVRSLAAGKEPR